MSATPEYWFPAKRYGWGWGWPKVWQGRLVMTVFYGLVFAGAFKLLPGSSPGPFVLYVSILSAVLALICWIKGEPPRWRSGGR